MSSQARLCSASRARVSTQTLLWAPASVPTLLCVSGSGFSADFAVSLGSDFNAAYLGVRLFSGSAAGCEARLRLAGATQSIWALPLVRPWPNSFRPKAVRGAEPKVSSSTNGEAEPRLTSGGEAGKASSGGPERRGALRFSLTSGGKAAALLLERSCHGTTSKPVLLETIMGPSQQASRR